MNGGTCRQLTPSCSCSSNVVADYRTRNTYELRRASLLYQNGRDGNDTRTGLRWIRMPVRCVTVSHCHEHIPGEYFFLCYLPLCAGVTMSRRLPSRVFSRAEFSESVVPPRDRHGNTTLRASSRMMAQRKEPGRTTTWSLCLHFNAFPRYCYGTSAVLCAPLSCHCHTRGWRKINTPTCHPWT